MDHNQYDAETTSLQDVIRSARQMLDRTSDPLARIRLQATISVSQQRLAEHERASQERQRQIDDARRAAEQAAQREREEREARGEISAAGWHAIVTRLRRAVIERELRRCVISPRATVNGVKLVKSGCTLAQTLDATILDRVDEDARTVLESVLTPRVRERLQHERQADAKAVRTPYEHRRADLLLKMARAGVFVWLTGPAGSGKTTAVSAVAKTLNLRFRFTGAIETRYDLMGFVDAHGRETVTALRDTYQHGGVFLFDECDASMTGATLAFNAALANGHSDFPGCVDPIQQHPDFLCFAAGNAINGSTTEYTGRNTPDAAFLDRFVVLRWPYDEDLELEIAQSVTQNFEPRALPAQQQSLGSNDAVQS